MVRCIGQSGLVGSPVWGCAGGSAWALLGESGSAQEAYSQTPQRVTYGSGINS